MNSNPSKSANRLLLAGATAVSTAVASTLCCIAPLLYLLFGVSSPWLVSLGEWQFLQVPMLIISLIALGYGFWLVTFSKKILCNKYLSRPSLSILYGLMFVLTLFFLSYPYVLPWILE